MIAPASFARRNFLKLAGLGVAASALSACTRETSVSPADWQPLPTLPPTPTMRPQEALSPEVALTRLVEGNQRFMAGDLLHPDYGPARRRVVAWEQKPFATLLSCADSRVPPEIIFDQGLGDLFVVRVAGNLLSANILASIEYAAEHLGSPLVMVMGHKKCGAVKAAVETIASGSEAPGHIASLVTAIEPAVAAAQIKEGGDFVDTAIRENVLQVVENLLVQSPLLAELYERAQIRLVGGYYDLDSGEVEILTA
jgi:carbonic anhydrase